MAKASAEIRSLARAQTDKALKVLMSIAYQPKAPAAARVAAANSILDRGWGKAAQVIEATINRPAEITDDELAHIAAGSSEGAVEAPIDPTQLN